jgi:hypothetical protein
VSFWSFPRIAVAGGAIAIALAPACHASVGGSAGAKAATSGEASASADGSASGSAAAEGSAEGTARQPTFGAAGDEQLAGDPLNVAESGTAAPASGVVLLGARHDLRLTTSAASKAVCTCMAVALGNASSADFDWLSGPPKTDPEVQLVIALGSAGVPCSGEPKDSLGASYWGYRWSGDDIVVLVEPAKRGRPITTGAVIPKPMGAGKVYVEPVARKLPYGHSLSNAGGRCPIGNPGRARTRPRSVDEMPGAAPAESETPATLDNTPEIVNPE